MLEKTLESPLDSKEIQLVNPKGNQPQGFGKAGKRDSRSVFMHLTYALKGDGYKKEKNAHLSSLG